MLIEELAREAGPSKDGVRHYEALGLIRSVPRGAGSRTYRDYDSSTVDTVALIRGAQHFLCLQLRKIGQLLATLANACPTKAQTIAFLEQRLGVVGAQIGKLPGG